MAQTTVRLICDDDVRARWVRRKVEEAGIAHVDRLTTAEVIRAGSEPCKYDLTIYYLAGGEGFVGVDAALWGRSTSRRSSPIVALSDRYDEDSAVTLFRMGVTEYLGVEEHRDRIADVIAGLTSRRVWLRNGPARTRGDVFSGARDGDRPARRVRSGDGRRRG
jgi:DNA-binding response OmpR family regulator